MPIKINYINDNEKGMTLIEVLASLAILALLTTAFLALFTNSTVWIARAGDETIASEYASSIIETIRDNASDLIDLDLTDGPLSVIDTNLSDNQFQFILNTNTYSVPIPQDIIVSNTTVTISQHDYSAYYRDSSDNELIADDDIYLKDNLFQIDVDVKWNSQGHSKTVRVSTILGAR